MCGRPAHALLDVRGVEAARQPRGREVLQLDEPLLEPHRPPDRLPELDAAPAVREVVRPHPEELPDRARELLRRQLEFLRDRGGQGGGQVGARLHREEAAVLAHHLVGREVVVHVGQVDVEEFVPQERERLEGVERVERDEARNLPVSPHRLRRPVHRCKVSPHPSRHRSNRPHYTRRRTHSSPAS